MSFRDITCLCIVIFHMLSVFIILGRVHYDQSGQRICGFPILI